MALFDKYNTNYSVVPKLSYEQNQFWTQNDRNQMTQYLYKQKVGALKF